MLTLRCDVGFQVAPAELEDLLLKSPDVADAAVIGIHGYVPEPLLPFPPANLSN